MELTLDELSQLVRRISGIEGVGFELLAESPEGQGDNFTKTIKFQDSTGRDLVGHLFRNEALLDRRTMSVASVLRSEGSIAVAPKVFSWDGWNLTLRDFMNLLRAEIEHPEGSLEKAELHIRGILDELARWHHAGIYHRDLRPENIAIARDGRVQFIDFWATRLLPTSDARASSAYWAPESLGAEHLRATRAGNMYAFARIAAEIMLPFHGDRRHPRAARLEHQVAWLQDYFRTVDPSARGDAKAVTDVLFTDVEAAPKSVFFSSGSRASLALLQAALGVEVEAHAIEAIDRDIQRHPETELALRSASTRFSFAAWRSLDIFSSQVHSRAHQAKEPELSTVDKQDLPTDIDLRWRTSVHRFHFGTGIETGHEERIQQLQLSPEEKARDEVYYRHLEQSKEIRHDLIEQQDFYYTADVAELLSGDQLSLGSSEIVTLRQWGNVLAVPDHDRWLYPAFQFHPTASVVSPLIKQVFDHLSTPKGHAEDEWSMLAFWCEPREQLGGQSFKDVIWDENSAALVASYIGQISLDRISEPPFWFHAPSDLGLMSEIEGHLRATDAGQLENAEGDMLRWSRSDDIRSLAWSSHVATPGLFLQAVAALEKLDDAASAAVETDEGVRLLNAAEAARLVDEAPGSIKFLRVEVSGAALIWRPALTLSDRVMPNEVAVVFDNHGAKFAERAMRLTGTSLVAQCAFVAVQGVVVVNQ